MMGIYDVGLRILGTVIVLIVLSAIAPHIYHWLGWQ